MSTKKSLEDPKKEKKQRKEKKTNKICKGMFMYFLTKAFLIFRVLFEKVVDFLFSLYWDSKCQRLPDLTKRHAILSESAVSLAAKIRNKELKSEDLVNACIERIKEVNPLINAITDERFEHALNEAREVDKLIEGGLSEEYFKEKPFLGVPFTAKESHAMSGMLHTLGLQDRSKTRAADDAECVRLMRAAGAIALAVTNVPEVNKWHETRNLVFGQTNNPYHLGRTTGGSSGGEAALAACLACPISLCSDIGGSTRLPAFYCGLFGYNPTAGHTSLKGSALRSGEEPTMASIGFVSKHCEDLAPLVSVVAGAQAHLLDLQRDVNVKDLKVYYVETAKDLRVSPICKDLRNAMKKVIAKFTELAPSSDKAPRAYYHGGLDHMYALWRHAMTLEAGEFALQLTSNQYRVNGLLELVKKLTGRSQYTGAAIIKLLDDQVLPPVDKAWAEELLRDLKEDLVGQLGADGVLVFPSAPAPAPYHYALYTRPYNFAYCAVLNALHLPSVQVPLGLDGAGLPLGVQVVAGPRGDALCLAAAAQLERAFGGFRAPCARIT